MPSRVSIPLSLTPQHVQFPHSRDSSIVRQCVFRTDNTAQLAKEVKRGQVMWDVNICGTPKVDAKTLGK